jgi:hypothetical protein
MRHDHFVALIGVAVVLAWLTASSCASANTGPQSLKRIEKCMVTVLIKTPGAKLIAWHMPPMPMINQASYPFLEYDFRGHFIQFNVQTWNGQSYSFATGLPIGLFTPGAPRPPYDDWGTGDLEKRWKSLCGAEATTISV